MPKTNPVKQLISLIPLLYLPTLSFASDPSGLLVIFILFPLALINAIILFGSVLNAFNGTVPAFISLIIHFFLFLWLLDVGGLNQLGFWLSLSALSAFIAIVISRSKQKNKDNNEITCDE